MADVLERLYGVIEERGRLRPDGSYVTRLLEGGIPAIAAKLREETGEFIEAAGQGDERHTAEEAADLIFHLWVLLGACGVAPNRVYAVLEERFGIGGLDEKASRGSTRKDDDAG